MFQAMVAGFVLRFLQCLAQAAPFILAGLLIAAVFQRLVGAGSTRKLFGIGTRRSLLQAWIIGMLLPVCSLGAIPIVREMRRIGLAGGTILAFAMSAPLFNPLSLLYGLTLSEPMTILAFAMCSLLVVTAVGFLWDRIFPNSASADEDLPPVGYGLKRMLAVATAAARESVGPTLAYILIGLAGVAVLGVVLPPNSLQRTMNYDNAAAPLLMSAIAIPVYATPMLAMSQLGMMFQHANSIGAAFVLLVLGAGMNIGLVVWMLKTYGPRQNAVWFALLLTVVVGLAYGVDRPLFPSNIDPADHTHAFDIYCRPFGYTKQNYFIAAVTKLKRDIQPYEWYSLGLLGSVVLSGFALKLADPGHKLETWLEKPVEVTQQKGIDIVIPGPVLGLIALLGLIVLSGVGCFAYYPPPDDVFAEIDIVRGEALSAALTGDTAAATYWIEVYDDWTRKLEVGVYLRQWELSDYHHMKARLVREKLELLEHMVLDKDEKRVSQLISDISRSTGRLREAYKTLN